MRSLVKNSALKTGSNHKVYLDITLADKTGDINAKKWDVSEDEAALFSTIKDGSIVKIKAVVSEWNGIRQMKVARLRLLADTDEILMNDFVKAAPEDPKEMFEYIRAQAESIKETALSKLCVEALDENKEKLLYYPAAKSNHHAELGGLLYHTRRMLSMGIQACNVYTNLDKDWVIAGVIMHDMEKLNELQSNELGVSPGYSFEGKLLGHIAQGVKAIEKMGTELGLPEEKKIMLEHMILSHHYEPDFGSPIKPLFPEAELLHYLDMLDAKMFDFEAALQGVEPGAFSERQRTLDGRMIYRPSFD